MPLGLRTGVLIVGSLDWESKDYGGAWACEQKPHRVVWRSERLRDDATFMVRVPTRYGRLSGSRNNTYTMVISPEYAMKLGTGKVIRCRRDVDSAKDLIDEARQLWRAEDDNSNGRCISKGWGCVTILVPPDFHDVDEEAKEARKAFLAAWAKHTKGEGSYGRLSFSQGDKAAAGGGEIICDGCLQIEWPLQTSGEALPLDLLLLTATDPGLGVPEKQDQYPSPQQIAAAWNKNGHVYYFRCNRLAGIHTVDDPAIEKFLGASDQPKNAESRVSN